jgi:hypothetical protein
MTDLVLAAVPVHLRCRVSLRMGCQVHPRALNGLIVAMP